jgi:hypothetical protein
MMDLQQMQHPQDAPTGNPPMLGADNPVTSNTSPAQSGLSVLGNPLAQQLQSQGRGEDTMLVHMTPNEVNSLQGLAMAHGGSLTINPHTGLVEAGWLGKLLPTILGAIATPLTGGLINPLTASALIGAGTGIATGSLKKGLMAGLQAYGGASLGGALGLNAGSFGIGQAANAAKGLGGLATSGGANAGITSAEHAFLTQAGGTAVPAVGSSAGLAAAAPSITGTEASFLTKAGGQFVPKAPGLIARFGAAAKAGLPAGTPNIIRNAAPMLATSGLTSGISGAMTPSTGTATSGGQIDNSYTGPYYAEPRKVIASPTTEELKTKSGERNWFDVSQPAIFNTMGQMVQPGSNTAQGTIIMRPILNPNAKKGEPMYTYTGVPYMGGVPSQTGYAAGGELHMDEGGFVIPARAVAEAGNGYTDAGFERFAKMGGIPLRGKGDGVSDDIPARIGSQRARVAAGEVYMPPEAVRRAGGAKKLYALVDRAHRAHKRGQNSSIAKGLGAL